MGFRNLKNQNITNRLSQPLTICHTSICQPYFNFWYGTIDSANDGIIQAMIEKLCLEWKSSGKEGIF